MDLIKGKEKFIELWGSLGSQWGINRTMAQIHALLLVSTHPLSTEEIMENLKISRGNANMNTRSLIDWGLVHKVLKHGERKEYFIAESDMWEVSRKIAAERRKRELSPLIDRLHLLGEFKASKGNKEEKHFSNLIEEITEIAVKSDKFLKKIEKTEQNWFTNALFKFMKK